MPSAAAGGRRRIDADTARDVEAAVVGFFRALDRFDDARALDLVADEVEWVRPAGTVRGREAVRQVLAARPRSRLTRHLVANLDLEADGAGSVIARFDVLVFDKAFDGEQALPAAVPGPSMVLSSEDRLIQHGDGGPWRIVRKQPTTVFKIQA